jgi:hypothetical protein
MFSGRDALVSIEQAIGGARTSEGRLDAALQSAIDEAGRLRRQETEGFRALAQARLDLIMRDQTVGDLDAAEQRALELIEHHRQEIEGLARRRDITQVALQKAESTKHERDQILASALEVLDEQRHRTDDRLKSDKALIAARADVDFAESVAANADEKASFTEADLAAKRQPYEGDPIFMYLWNKKHGQAEDTSGSFVKFFDRKLARLVGYRDARANYAMLQEIPLRLREHAASKKADVAASEQRVAEIVRQALVVDGIEKFEAEVQAAEDAAKTVGETVVKLNEELDAIEVARQKTLDADENAAFDQAVTLLTEALSRADIRQLYEEALKTPSRADDQAIASISTARKALEKTDAEIAQIRSEIRDMARRRSELEVARDRARENGYDDPRGNFGSTGKDIVGEVIGGILGGVIRGGALDDIFRDNYRVPRRPSGPIFRDTTGAPSWPNPWGKGQPTTWGPSGPRRSAPPSGSGWRTGGRF